VAKAYLFQLPLFVQWSFPIAALVAAVFTIHSMTTHREIVAAKAGGISFHRVARPVLVMGLLLTVVALGLTELVPRSNRVAAQILRDEDPRRSWRADFVYQSENGTTWQVGRLDAPERRMDNVIIEVPPGEGRGGLHVMADAMYHDSQNGWTFARGYLRRFSPDSTQRVYQFERMSMAGMVEAPQELLEAPRQPDEMTYAEVDRLARVVERSGGDPAQLLVKREQKFSIPVATLVVILFGVPLATSTGRGGTAYGIGVSLGTTILYLLLFKVAGALGQAGTMAPLTAAWIPNVLCLAAAAVLLRRVRT
jgi:lipopolysaccharide export system permease protein